jgi:hypothetical protein
MSGHNEKLPEWLQYFCPFGFGSVVDPHLCPDSCREKKAQEKLKMSELMEEPRDFIRRDL